MDKYYGDYKNIKNIMVSSSLAWLIHLQKDELTKQMQAKSEWRNIEKQNDIRFVEGLAQIN